MEITLAPMQMKAVELGTQGKNLFITGVAGTGKSLTLNRICEALQEQGKNVVLTGTTGISATNIGGRTIHSYAGLLNTYTKKKEELMKRTDVLIIDEISMLSAQAFQEVSDNMMRAKGSIEPFGGVQLILLGDFFQL